MGWHWETLHSSRPTGRECGKRICLGFTHWLTTARYKAVVVHRFFLEELVFYIEDRRWILTILDIANVQSFNWSTVRRFTVGRHKFLGFRVRSESNSIPKEIEQTMASA